MFGQIFLFIILPAAIFFNILYLVVRAAVRDGIIQADKQRLKAAHEPKIDAEKIEPPLNKILCRGCGNIYSKKWPLCPACGTTKTKQIKPDNEEEKS